MAANDYYNSHAHQEPASQPYYQNYEAPRPALPTYNSAAPSYHSNAPTPRPTQPSPVSPFEAPFDDHVYPIGGPQRQDNFRHNDSHSTLGQDTAYYGQGGGGRPQDSTGSFRDDIPLQNQPHQKPYAGETDHVYDAGESGIPPGVGNGKAKRRSALGTMFQGKGSKKRIPWVVYCLTIIQSAVFIAEIVKNGKNWTRLLMT